MEIADNPGIHSLEVAARCEGVARGQIGDGVLERREGRKRRSGRGWEEGNMLLLMCSRWTGIGKVDDGMSRIGRGFGREDKGER